jgi:hypothetical protein
VFTSVDTLFFGAAGAAASLASGARGTRPSTRDLVRPAHVASAARGSMRPFASLSMRPDFTAFATVATGRPRDRAYSRCPIEPSAGSRPA